MAKRRMILGLSHDTCPVCGKDIQMRNDRKLYHHGHPARPCPGAGGLGVRMTQFMADVTARYDGPGASLGEPSVAVRVAPGDSGSGSPTDAQYDGEA